MLKVVTFYQHPITIYVSFLQPFANSVVRSINSTNCDDDNLFTLSEAYITLRQFLLDFYYIKSMHLYTFYTLYELVFTWWQTFIAWCKWILYGFFFFGGGVFYTPRKKLWGVYIDPYVRPFVRSSVPPNL